MLCHRVARVKLHRVAPAFVFLSLCSGVLASPSLAQAAEPFAGKTIEVLVGHDAGGGYDLYTRVMVRHMANHIPGAPAMVVKNMPGAGGLRVAGFLANGAAKDGTNFGLFDRGGVIEPLLGNPGARFDGSKLTAIGSIGKQVATCAAWHQAPVQTIQRAQEKELLVGDVLAGPSGPVLFPVPWARTPESSFLATPQGLRDLLEKAGFTVAAWSDTTDTARAWFVSLAEKIRRDGLPPLGFHVLLGSDFQAMAQNQRRNLEEGRIVLAQVVAKK